MRKYNYQTGDELRTSRRDKKAAKQILAGKLPRGYAMYTEVRRPRTDGTCVITELIPQSRKLRAEIRRQYERRYGDLWCHWDSPYIVDIEWLS